MKKKKKKSKNTYQTFNDNWENIANVIRKELIRKIVETIMLKFYLKVDSNSKHRDTRKFTKTQVKGTERKWNEGTGGKIFWKWMKNSITATKRKNILLSSKM